MRGKWGENDDEWICFDVFFVFLEGPLQMFKARYSRVSNPNRAWPPDPTWDDPLESRYHVGQRVNWHMVNITRKRLGKLMIQWCHMMSYAVRWILNHVSIIAILTNTADICRLDKLDKEKCDTCDTCDTSTCEIWTLGAWSCQGTEEAAERLWAGGNAAWVACPCVCVCVYIYIYVYIYIWSFVMMYRRLSCIILLSLILHSHQGSGFNSKAIFGVP